MAGFGIGGVESLRSVNRALVPAPKEQCVRYSETEHW
jgi:hypothetical protein